MKPLIIVLLCFCFHTAAAQTGRAWESLLGQLVDAEEVSASEWEEMTDQLELLERHPLDVNTATREQWQQLVFLTEQQVMDIQEYVERHGGMRSVSELRLVSSLNGYQLQLLPFFVSADGGLRQDSFPSLRTIARYGRHELMGMGRIPFYERKGDRNGYLGYKYRHWLRYDFSFGDNVRLGLVGSQDAGEPFFANKNRAGYDFYSLYGQLRDLGRLEQLAVGKYKLSFGMGLVLNSGFSLGKLATLSNLGRSTRAVRVHASRSSADYFQGVAATVRVWRGLTATVFASYRPLDATLNKVDSSAATILTDGYHRTQTEMAKKNDLHATSGGGNVNFRADGFHIGATAVYTRLDRRLSPNTSTLYRRYYAAGTDFLNVSTDYGLTTHSLSVSGETAIDGHGSLATLNTVSLNLTDGLSLLGLQRFYSYRYTSLHASSMSEGGHVQNESGAYVGVTWQPLRQLRVLGYTDFSYFPWARYRVSQSSHAWDNLAQVTWTPGHWQLLARYRWHRRQYDNADKTALDDRTEQRARLSAAFLGASGWGLAAQADLSKVEQEKGWMLTGNLTGRLRWLQWQLTGGYFRTDSYDTRLYIYERGMRYTYSNLMFYGRGLRLAALARADVGTRLMLMAKLGITKYYDRDHISSGYQQIDGTSQTDLDVQVRWLF